MVCCNHRLETENEISQLCTKVSCSEAKNGASGRSPCKFILQQLVCFPTGDVSCLQTVLNIANVHL